MATHSDVAHRWAQDDSDARKIASQRMWFDRQQNNYAGFLPSADEQVIYSHGTHWPLAAFQTTPRRAANALFC